MFKQADIDALTLPELTDLQSMIEISRQKQIAEAKSRLLASMREQAEAAGLTLEDVLTGPDFMMTTPRKVAAKYKNPNNPSETWAGRGMKPKWMTAYIAEGGKMEDCAV